MTDVNLYQTDDDGEIDYVNGQAVMANGWRSAVYLSMFGGNIDDAGDSATKSRRWWGGLGESVDFDMVSRTQYLVQTIPATTHNMLRIQSAAEADLAWMTGYGVTDVTVTVTIPAVNRVDILVAAVLDGEIVTAEFVRSWGVQS